MNKRQIKYQQFIKEIDGLINQFGVDSNISLKDLRKIFEEMFIMASNDPDEEDEMPFFVTEDEVAKMRATMTPNKLIDWLHQHYEIKPMVPVLTDEDLKEVDKWMKEHKD